MSDQYGPQPQRGALLMQHRRYAEKPHTQANRTRQKAAANQCQTDLFRQRRTLRTWLQLAITPTKIADSNLNTNTPI